MADSVDASFRKNKFTRAEAAFLGELIHRPDLCIIILQQKVKNTPQGGKFLNEVFVIINSYSRDYLRKLAARHWQWPRTYGKNET